jgi:hypothetical protein
LQAPWVMIAQLGFCLVVSLHPFQTCKEIASSLRQTQTRLFVVLRMLSQVGWLI